MGFECCLYDLAIKYIGRCNKKWKKNNHPMVQNTKRLTYSNGDKYYLFYGADAEWQHFASYDVLDNAIQRLAEYENTESKKSQMINAYEARRRTVMATKCKDIMKEIEISIDEATKAGFYDTSISLDNPDKKIIDALCEELTKLDYKVRYDPAEPLPIGCPSDQWDFYSHLWIGWKLKEGGIV